MADPKAPKADTTAAVPNSPEANEPAVRSDGGKMLARLASASSRDKFVISMADGDFEVTNEGVEVDASKVEALIEIANYNGVALVVEPVEKGN